MVVASRTIEEEEAERRADAARWHRVVNLVEQHPLYSEHYASDPEHVDPDQLVLDVLSEVLTSPARTPSAPAADRMRIDVPRIDDPELQVLLVVIPQLEHLSPRARQSVLAFTAERFKP